MMAFARVTELNGRVQWINLDHVRQIVSVLDLIRIERGQSPYTALELRPE